MAKGAFIGVDSKARKIKKMYIGVDGKARKVKKAYIGVDGKARLFWSGGAGKWVALTTANSYTSTDLTTWSASDSTFKNSYSVTYGNGKFFVGDFKGSGSYTIWSSSDGLTWTSVKTFSYVGITTLRYMNGKLFICATGGRKYFYYSNDNGVTWTTVSTPSKLSDNVTNYNLQGIAYGLVDGETSPKYFVYLNMSESNGSTGIFYPDKILVYNESFQYEKELVMPTFNSQWVSMYQTCFIGVSDGSLKIIHDRRGTGVNDAGHLIFTTYKDSTFKNVYSKSKPSTSTFTVTGCVCVDGFTTWIMPNVSTLCKYDESTDSVTASTTNLFQTSLNGIVGCYDGDKYVVVNGTKASYSSDKGTTWTQVRINSSSSITFRDAICCDIDGGGIVQN